MEFPITDLLSATESTQWDPSHRRANKQRGRGTYDHDRPPMVGTMGRESGHVRQARCPEYDWRNPCPPRCIHSLTRHAIVSTDESNGYHHIIHVHATVNQSVHEYARDDDGDGMRACIATRWKACGRMSAMISRLGERRSPETPGWSVVCEFRRNRKRVSPAFMRISRHLSHFLHLSDHPLLMYS